MSNKKGIHHISIDEPTKDFKQHIEFPDNSRILFSGAFGSGKTYFLNYFFNDHQKDYLAIRIAPTNYTVSANEDIFNLIKYDILTGIITHPDFAIVGFDKFELSGTQKLGILFKSIDDNFFDLFKDTYVGKTASGLKAIHDTATSLKGKIKEVEELDEKRKNEFIKELEKDSAVLEYDFISSLINDLLLKLADGRKTVLVIDDLDRIDPTHIFRILNIFSVHMDFWGEGMLKPKDSHTGDESTDSSNEKFGFDKVCVVCDINNIRNIYTSRFGANTDFNGYIDKFYVYDVFEFDNIENVKKEVENFLLSINHNWDLLNALNYQNYIRKGVIVDVVSYMVQSGVITIRQLNDKYNGTCWIDQKPFDYSGNKSEMVNWQLPPIIIFELLAWVIGDKNALEVALKKTVGYDGKQSVHSSGFQAFIGQLLLIFDMDKNRLKSDSVEPQYKIDYSGYHLEYRVESYTVQARVWNSEIIGKLIGNREDLEGFPMMKLLYETYLKIKDKI